MFHKNVFVFFYLVSTCMSKEFLHPGKTLLLVQLAPQFSIALHKSVDILSTP